MKLVGRECDLAVSAEAENAVQALEAIEDQHFDLAIVDISLEGINGLELTSRMKSRCPNITILILSIYEGLLYAQRALRAGAAGYVAKYEAPEKIMSAIRQVLGGKVYFNNSKTAKEMHGAAADVGDDLNSRVECAHNLLPITHRYQRCGLLRRVNMEQFSGFGTSISQQEAFSFN